MLVNTAVTSFPETAVTQRWCEAPSTGRRRWRPAWRTWTQWGRTGPPPWPRTSSRWSPPGRPAASACSRWCTGPRAGSAAAPGRSSCTPRSAARTRATTCCPRRCSCTPGSTARSPGSRRLQMVDRRQFRGPVVMVLKHKQPGPVLYRRFVEDQKHTSGGAYLNVVPSSQYWRPRVHFLNFQMALSSFGSAKHVQTL